MNAADVEHPWVKVLEPAVYGYERGFFFETWRDSAFRKNFAG
jgi:dTDP-4-dehydrorhamnose 3,5-epimerase